MSFSLCELSKGKNVLSLGRERMKKRVVSEVKVGVEHSVVLVTGTFSKI